MTQRQTQSQFSRVPSQGQSQGPSLSPPTSPDATSPYQGPAQDEKPEKRPEHVADPHGPDEMAHPYFSEAQSTMAAFAPVERPGDPFAEPEDPISDTLTSRPADQPHSASTHGAEFVTSAGTLREGMAVVDSYGHTVGVVAGVDGERLRLSSTDPHDDGVAFLPVGLIDGVDGDRVLLGGRGDASFGMSGE